MTKPKRPIEIANRAQHREMARQAGKQPPIPTPGTVSASVQMQEVWARYGIVCFERDRLQEQLQQAQQQVMQLRAAQPEVEEEETLPENEADKGEKADGKEIPHSVNSPGR